MQPVALHVAAEMPTCVEYGVPSTLFVPHHSHAGKQKMDMASMVIFSNSTEKKLQLCAQSSECWDCPLMSIMDIPSDRNSSLMVDSRFPVKLHVFNKNGGTSLCSVEAKLEQYSEYKLWVNSNQDMTDAECVLVTSQTAADSNLPVYTALAVLLGLQLLWILVNFLYRKGCFKRVNLIPSGDTETLINSDLGTPTGNARGPAGLLSITPRLPVIPHERLRSLDAFRGLSLIVMVFVNYRGGYFWYFKHSAWNGLTVADLVFPWFVFIMGTSMALSFRSLLRKGVRRKKLLLKTVKRAIILFFLGLIISNRAKLGRTADPATVRIPGVLQRLSICYLVIAAMECVFARADDPYESRKWAVVRDVLPFWPEWLISFAILALHAVLTFCLPVPDCPTGYLGPGGLHGYRENSSQSQVNCTGGSSGYIDRWLFGSHHIYSRPSSTHIYLTTMSYDPEGVLGTLPAIFLCFLGLQAGKVLLIHKGWKSRLSRWIFWSLFTGLAGGILCDFSQNSGWIPVNKNLWSISYILALAAMAFILLIVFYLLIDVFHIWSGAPFFYPGMNSILIYMCHELFDGYFPIQFHVPKTHAAQLAMSLYGALLWTLVSVVLYHKKIFVAI